MMSRAVVQFAAMSTLLASLCFRRAARKHIASLLFHHIASRRSVTMQASNRLRSVFSAGAGPSMGLWQMLPGANVSRVLARTGVDWVMVDCEHGNIDGKLFLAG
jgi:hypothetical protein